jgi:hypothetical protein
MCSTDETDWFVLSTTIKSRRNGKVIVTVYKCKWCSKVFTNVEPYD